MTPVPLDLPLRPGEAARIAALIFDHAEGKPLTEELRNRLAARAVALKLESIKPWFGSLSRDPVHPGSYYLAIDTADTAPLLLHMALSTAPTSSIFHKPLLIGRTRPLRGPEFVINSIPFSSEDRENIERFAAHIDSAFLPRLQGSRASITVATDFPGALEVFRAILKRTGRNLAALAGDYHAGLWAVIRAGWRQEYSMVARGIPQTLAYTRYVIDVSSIDPLDAALKAAEYQHEEIRQARAALKMVALFEFEAGLGRITADQLRISLEWLRDRGHAPQFVTIAPAGDLDAISAIARMHQVTLSFQYAGEPVGPVARAASGRLNYHVTTPAEAGEIAEQLLG